MQPVAGPAERAPRRRYHSLDGLRGVAAFVVLICHSLLLLPQFMQAFVDPTKVPEGGWQWWAIFSPLHLTWAGTEAVDIFFVLSGFVLTLPFVRGISKGWFAYYPKRLARLYLPVWGAFVLSYGWMVLVPRVYTTESSIWLANHPTTLSPAQIRGDLLLWPPPLGSNPVLWSLTFEVIFSLLLPIYVIGARYFPRLNLLKFVALIGTVIYFAPIGTTPKYHLPMFGLGAIMAVETDRMAYWGERIRRLRWSWLAWGLLTAVCMGLLNSYWALWGASKDAATLTTLIPWSRGATLLGASLLLFIAIEGGLRTWLERPSIQWLGKRSFSLYLVHNPIVITVGVLLGAHPNALIVLLITVPGSLLVAEGFYRVVEHPSQTLCKAIERGAVKLKGLWGRPLEPAPISHPVPVPVTESSRL